MSDDAHNLAVARRYLKAIEAGTLLDEANELFSPQITMQWFPNRLMPNGSTSGVCWSECSRRTRQKVDGKTDL